MPLKQDEIERIVARDHSDPHRVLGAHPARTGVRITAYRPDADAVLVHTAKTEPLRLRRVHASGLFSGVAKGATLPLRYELEARMARRCAPCATSASAATLAKSTALAEPPSRCGLPRRARSASSGISTPGTGD